jgi:6-phosphogluconolactonase
MVARMTGSGKAEWLRVASAADALDAAATVLSASLVRFPRPRLAIAGGSAAAALGSLRGRLGPKWGSVRLTWVDERCVPFANPDSNRGTSHRRGDLAEAAPPAVELPLFLDEEEPAQAVARVEQTLVRDFDGGLDVLLLGLGEDGHIASLFPEHPARLARGLAAHVKDSPKPPADRITLTLGVLETASVAVVVALGEGKRAALERALRGPREASLLSTLSGVTVVTDLELGEGT